MRVFFDEQIFLEQEHGGISRYICELAIELAHTGKVAPVIYGGFSRNQTLCKLNQQSDVRCIFSIRRDHLRINSLVASLSRYWRRRVFQRLRRERGYLIYHPTFYEVDPFIASRADATVLTCHDMIPEWLSVQSSSARQKWFIAQKRAGLIAADAIIANSESTRRDLEKYLPQVATKVTVSLLAARQITSCKPFSPTPSVFFLFVGKRDKYKNGLMAWEAAHRLIRSGVDCHFVCFGGGKWSYAESVWLKQHQLHNLILQTNGDDATLAWHYQHAVALIYPSRYEGFGLPVLEAMKHNCPVITTACSSLPEVGGKAVVYIDPDNPGQLAREMRRVLIDAKHRTNLIANGADQSEKFSWARTAEQTAEVYAETTARCNRSSKSLKRVF